MFTRVQRKSLSLFAGGLLAAGIFPAAAGAASISSGNSSLTINPSGPGAYITSWTVDGVDQFGGSPSGSDNIEFNNGTNFVGINTLSVQGTPFFGSGISNVTYGGVFDGFNFTINVKDILSGGLAGSGSSGISEQITVNNLGQVQVPQVENPAIVATPTFQILDVVDYNVNATATNDTLTLSPNPNPNTATQTDPTGAMVTYTATPTPDTAALFQNGSPVTLPGPAVGDAAFNFQWNLSIPSGQSQTISITEAASGINTPPTTIPLPSASWTCLWTLSGLGVFGLVKRIRRTIA